MKCILNKNISVTTERKSLFSMCYNPCSLIKIEQMYAVLNG